MEGMLAAFKWQGVNEVAAEELAALPGMNEGSVLLWLDEFVQSGGWDLVVVDSAPTGETLTMLTLPQVTEWWLTKAFPFQKAAIRTAGGDVPTIELPRGAGIQLLRSGVASRLDPSGGSTLTEIWADVAIPPVRRFRLPPFVPTVRGASAFLAGAHAVHNAAAMRTHATSKVRVFFIMSLLPEKSLAVVVEPGFYRTTGRGVKTKIPRTKVPPFADIVPAC
jgi:hypothetical protein